MWIQNISVLSYLVNRRVRHVVTQYEGCREDAARIDNGSCSSRIVTLCSRLVLAFLACPFEIYQVLPYLEEHVWLNVWSSADDVRYLTEHNANAASLLA